MLNFLLIFGKCLIILDSITLTIFKLTNSLDNVSSHSLMSNTGYLYILHCLSGFFMSLGFL